jgi:DNA-binding winged helix-turn-helix (wHTH) protein/tetratricopeptide (TPR) repeat protein
MRYRFADCVLDADRFELRRGGSAVAVQPKVLHLLLHLLRQRDRTVTKDELLDAVWPGVATGEGSLTRAISLARDAVGERERGASIIRTVRGRGYTIAVAVVVEAGAGPSASVAPSGDFLCREKELAIARDALFASVAGRGSVLLLSGEPGIGKTRLASELARIGHDRGVRVYWGRCHEGDGGPAYWPWIQVLSALIEEAGADRFAASATLPDLAELLPELRDRLPASGTPSRPAPVHPEQAQLRLFDAITRLLVAQAAENPLLLILDDLHCADASSLLLLRFLAQRIDAAPVLVVGAYRDVEPDAAEPLREALSDLARGQHPKLRLLLRGLTPACVRRFIAQLSGDEPAPALVEACHARSDGNPLFLLELLQWMLQTCEGALPADPDVWSAELPDGLRHVLRRRLGALSAACLRVLTEASVLGREFSVSVLAAVAGLDEDRILAELEEAERARVVEPLRASPGTLRFSHVLMREALYDELPTAQRVRLHRRVGEVLEERYGLRPEPPRDGEARRPSRLAELAHHFFQALPGGDAARALHYSTRAGDYAMSVLAFEEAAKHYEAALRVLDAAPSLPESSRPRLLVALADARYRAGDPSTSGQLLWQVVGSARAAGDAELLAEAAVRLHEYKIGGNVMVPVAQRLRVLEEARRRLPDANTALRARLLAALGSEVFWDDEPQRAVGILDEAAEIARRVGDAATAWHVHYARRLFRFPPSAVSSRSDLAGKMLRLAEETGDREREFLARMDFRLCEWIERADPAAIDLEIDACAALAEELRQPAFHWMVARAQAARAAWRGRFAEVEELLDQARAHGGRSDADIARLSHSAALHALRRMQGRLRECEAELREPGRLPQSRGHRWASLALLYAESGRGGLARRELDGLAAGDFAGVRVDSNFTFNLALLAETCFRLGDRPRAARLYALIAPYAGRYAAIQAIVTAGCLSRHLGLLATTLERWDEAETHFETALEVEQRMGALPFEAWVQRDYAHMLVRRAAPGDRDSAGERLAAAVKSAREVGLGGVPDGLAALARGAPAVVGVE